MLWPCAPCPRCSCFSHTNGGSHQMCDWEKPARMPTPTQEIQLPAVVSRAVSPSRENFPRTTVRGCGMRLFQPVTPRRCRSTSTTPTLHGTKLRHGRVEVKLSAGGVHKRGQSAAWRTPWKTTCLGRGLSFGAVARAWLLLHNLFSQGGAQIPQPLCERGKPPPRLSQTSG